MNISKKSIFISILFGLTLGSIGCNSAKSTALDSSKPGVGGIITAFPSFFLPLLYPVEILVDGGEPATIDENDELDINIVLQNPLSEAGDRIDFQITTSSSAIIISGLGENPYYSDHFSVDEQKTSIQILIDHGPDGDCLDQDYYIIATDTTTFVPQLLKIKTIDADKCTYIATNGGQGYSGSFVTAASIAASKGPVEVADEICANNVPDNLNTGSPSYKAMIAASIAPSFGLTRTPSVNWVFQSFTRYFAQNGTTEIFSFGSATTVNFNGEQFLENAFGSSGSIWTGFADASWGTGTAAITQCASAVDQAGNFSSWYNNGTTTGLTGAYGVLGKTDFRSISNYTTPPLGSPAGPLPILSGCTSRRNILCVEQ